jgi:hypothetical protein
VGATFGAKAPVSEGGLYRSAGSAAPPKTGPLYGSTGLSAPPKAGSDAPPGFGDAPLEKQIPRARKKALEMTKSK